MDELVHENMCSLIHKMWHPKSYHSDIKYHMTPNIIFDVVWTHAVMACYNHACELNVIGCPQIIHSTYYHCRPAHLELWTGDIHVHALDIYLPSL